jgi:hypothetical protein
MTTMTVAPEGLGTSNLEPLGLAGKSTDLSLAPPGAKKDEEAPTSVSLSDQGLVQVFQAAVTGLEPGKPYLIAFSSEPSGKGVLEPLQGFMTNPAGAAIVNAVGPIRQLVSGEDNITRRYLAPPITTARKAPTHRGSGAPRSKPARRHLGPRCDRLRVPAPWPQRPLPPGQAVSHQAGLRRLQ